MNFFKCSLTALLLSATFIACQKEKLEQIVTPQSEKKPAPLNEKSITGLWVGHSFLNQKSIPAYFSFNIKENGALDVLNSSQQVIGAGKWTCNGEVFKASYSIEVTGGSSYSVSAAYSSSPGKLNGTWGHNSNDSDGGFWEMTKVN